MKQSAGEGEGQVDLIAWAGYVEDGSTDPKVDWVTDFEKETGCQVNVKVGNTSDEMVTLMRTGQYDGVSASGDATLRLIAAGDVAPVNTDLIPNYADVYEGLKNQPHNSVNGQMYGALRPWREPADVADRRRQAGTDLVGRVWDENSPYKGKVTVRLADLHRRRGAVPDEDAAGPRDQEPVRARRRAVPGRDRPAEEAARDRRRVLVGLHEGARRLQVRRHGARNDVAGDREPGKADKVPVETRCRKKDRPAGPTPG